MTGRTSSETAHDWVITLRSEQQSRQLLAPFQTTPNECARCDFAQKLDSHGQIRIDAPWHAPHGS